MSERYWCDGPHCGMLAVVDGKPLHPYGCQGKPIPIATLCDPPEPTTIDESDLAPGMVGVVVGPETSLTYIVSMDAVLHRTGFVDASASAKMLTSDASPARWSNEQT